jgi:hypothetical protein
MVRTQWTIELSKTMAHFADNRIYLEGICCYPTDSNVHSSPD